MKARRFLTIMAVAAGVLWALGGPAVRADVVPGKSQSLGTIGPPPVVTIPVGWYFTPWNQSEPFTLSFVQSGNDNVVGDNSRYAFGSLAVDVNPQIPGESAESRATRLRDSYASGGYGSVNGVSQVSATTMGGKPAFAFQAVMLAGSTDRFKTIYIIIAGGGQGSIYLLQITASNFSLSDALTEQMNFIRESIKYGK